MALRVFYILEIVQKGRVSVHYVPIEENISELETKFLNKHRPRYPIGLTKDVRA